MAMSILHRREYGSDDRASTFDQNEMTRDVTDGYFAVGAPESDV